MSLRRWLLRRWMIILLPLLVTMSACWAVWRWSPVLWPETIARQTIFFDPSMRAMEQLRGQPAANLAEDAWIDIWQKRPSNAWLSALGKRPLDISNLPLRLILEGEREPKEQDALCRLLRANIDPDDDAAKSLSFLWLYLWLRDRETADPIGDAGLVAFVRAYCQAYLDGDSDGLAGMPWVQEFALNGTGRLDWSAIDPADVALILEAMHAFHLANHSTDAEERVLATDGVDNALAGSGPGHACWYLAGMRSLMRVCPESLTLWLDSYATDPEGYASLVCSRWVRVLLEDGNQAAMLESERLVRIAESMPETQRRPLHKLHEIIMANRRGDFRAWSSERSTAETIPGWVPDWAASWGEDDLSNGSRWAAFEVNEIRFRMRWLRPGIFCMGSPITEDWRTPYEIWHLVRLTNGFWLAEAETTQDLWQTIAGNDDELDADPSRFKGDDRPVERVSWNDCRRFIDSVNDLVTEQVFRLPTEAEWEYACRAGTNTPFNLGSTISTEQVNYDGRFPYGESLNGLMRNGKSVNEVFRNETVKVKSFKPNAWGLYEMHGNVYEWVQGWSPLCDMPSDDLEMGNPERSHDWYGDCEDIVVDPVGPTTGLIRIVRGGCWYLPAECCRSAALGGNEPDFRSDFLGFRLAADSLPQNQSCPKTCTPQ